jgi:hypothetical protein
MLPSHLMYAVIGCMPPLTPALPPSPHRQHLHALPCACIAMHTGSEPPSQNSPPYPLPRPTGAGHITAAQSPQPKASPRPTAAAAPIAQPTTTATDHITSTTSCASRRSPSLSTRAAPLPTLPVHAFLGLQRLRAARSSCAQARARPGHTPWTCAMPQQPDSSSSSALCTCRGTVHSAAGARAVPGPELLPCRPCCTTPALRRSSSRGRSASHHAGSAAQHGSAATAGGPPGRSKRQCCPPACRQQPASCLHHGSSGSGRCTGCLGCFRAQQQ